jgi:hypothetical protein
MTALGSLLRTLSLLRIILGLLLGIPSVLLLLLPLPLRILRLLLEY